MSLLPPLLQELEHAVEGLELKLLPVVSVDLCRVELGHLSHNVELSENSLLQLQCVQALSQFNFLLEGSIPEVEGSCTVSRVVLRANLRFKEGETLRDFSYLTERLYDLLLREILNLPSDPRKLGRERCSPLLLQDPELHAFLVSLSLVALCLLSQEF